MRRFNLFVHNVGIAGNKYRIASPEKAICDKVYCMRPAMNAAELETLVFDFIGIDRRRFHSLNLGEILCKGEKYHSKNVNLLMEHIIKIILGK